ncbi:MAG TPA: leucine-rich repeat domain-containing protein, partial [bacterium]|nr:leucine-rich repeat domain-containing protein [bacterium]
DLSSLANLDSLDLAACGLSDLSGLSGMKGLDILYLDGNNLNQIDALVNAYSNGSFHTQFSYISITNNPLAGASMGTDYTTLTGDGVTFNGYNPVQ